MEDKSTIQYWRPSGILEGIREENRATLCELLAQADEYINATHVIVVVRQIFFQITEGDLVLNDPIYGVILTNARLEESMDHIASELEALQHHIGLMRGMFGHTDLEADLIMLYANNKALEFTSPLR